MRLELSFAKAGNQRTYYLGIKMSEGKIVDTNFDKGEFLFDMRDLMLNIDGILEVQPIILPYDSRSSEGQAAIAERSK